MKQIKEFFLEGEGPTLRRILKFMTSQSEQQIFTIHILPNIFRSKGRQAMKSFLLKDHNVRIIFLQKLCKK